MHKDDANTHKALNGPFPDGGHVSEAGTTSESHPLMHDDHSADDLPSHESFWLSCLRIAVYVLVTLSVLGFTGRMFWWADFFAHPRMHFAVVLTLLAVIFTLVGDWMRLMVALAGISLNVLAISSSVLGTNNIYNAMAMPPGQLRVITVNVGDSSPQSPALQNWLASQNPDIVVLVEANHDWLPMLYKLVDALPYQKMADHTSNYGITILSRFPMDKTEVSIAGPLSLPSLTAEVETPIGRLAVVGVHPNPPGLGDTTRARDLYLAQLSAIAQTTTMPTLLVGDFNATPWSSGFETIRMLPNLQPGSIDAPATWPAMLSVAGLPTQHILLTIPYNKPRDIVFNDLHAGPALPGLSHLPLVADIRVR